MSARGDGGGAADVALAVTHRHGDAAEALDRAVGHLALDLTAQDGDAGPEPHVGGLRAGGAELDEPRLGAEAVAAHLDQVAGRGLQTGDHPAPDPAPRGGAGGDGAGAVADGDGRAAERPAVRAAHHAGQIAGAGHHLDLERLGGVEGGGVDDEPLALVAGLAEGDEVEAGRLDVGDRPGAVVGGDRRALRGPRARRPLLPVLGRRLLGQLQQERGRGGLAGRRELRRPRHLVEVLGGLRLVVDERDPLERDRDALGLVGRHGAVDLHTGRRGRRLRLGDLDLAAAGAVTAAAVVTAVATAPVVGPAVTATGGLGDLLVLAELLGDLGHEYEHGRDPDRHDGEHGHGLHQAVAEQRALLGGAAHLAHDLGAGGDDVPRVGERPADAPGPGGDQPTVDPCLARRRHGDLPLAEPHEQAVGGVALELDGGRRRAGVAQRDLDPLAAHEARLLGAGVDRELGAGVDDDRGLTETRGRAGGTAGGGHDRLHGDGERVLGRQRAGGGGDPDGDVGGLPRREHAGAHRPRQPGLVDADREHEQFARLAGRVGDGDRNRGRRAGADPQLRRDHHHGGRLGAGREARGPRAHVVSHRTRSRSGSCRHSARSAQWRCRAAHRHGSGAPGSRRPRVRRGRRRCRCR